MRRLKTSTLTAVTAAVALSLVAAACSSGDEGGADASEAPAEETTDEGGASEEPSDEASGGEAAAGGDFIDGAQLPAVPPHIDPLLTSELDGAQISQLLYDGLMEFAAEGEELELRPLAAESFEANEDATEFTFTIREGLTFSDGSPVMPSSFALGMNIAADPDTAADYSYLLSDIQGFQEVQDGAAEELSGVVADDEAMTLTVTLATPYADFPARVTHIIFSPMPEARRDLADQSQWERDVMIGNGPYVQEVPQNEQEIVVVRNDAWAGDVYGNTSATLDSVTFRIATDIDSAFAAFEAGEVQSASIPSGRYGDAAEYGNTIATPQLASYHWIFGMRDEDPLGGEENLPLRQAISLAIDREGIAEAIYDGARAPSTSVTPPGVPGFTEDLGEYSTYDVEQAQQLVDDFTSGGGELPPVTLVFNAGAGHEDVAAFVQQNLEAIGFTVTQEPRSSETYFDELRDGGCPGLCRAGWFFDFPVQDNGMYDLFHSDSIGGNNLGYYSNPAFDEAVNTARQTTDADERQSLFNEAESTLLNDDVAVAPLNWYTGDQVYAEGVEGYEQEPLGWVRYERITVSE